MSTVVTWQTESTTAETTETLAAKLGHVLRGGEAIELISDLGGGKTTFVRGLVRGAGSADHVSSPTFTISRVYEAPPRPNMGMVDPSNPPLPLEIHHFDFYRLHEPGIIAAELAEVVHDTGCVVVVEWAGVVQHVLPTRRLTITIEQLSTGTRSITFRCPEALNYLIAAVQDRQSI